VSVSFRVESLAFNSGERVDVPETGVVVIVGPNNAGKSALLRELTQWCTSDPVFNPPKVLREATFVKEGGREDLEAWLHDHARELRRPDGPYFRPPAGGEQQLVQLTNEWDAGPHVFNLEGVERTRFLIPNVQQFLLFLASAESRLSLIGSVAPHNPVADVPTHPLQVLFIQKDLEDELSETCFRAFGEELSLSRVVGGELALYLGKPTVEPSVVPDPRYLEELERMPKLQEQGDGMRSFMGLLLALSTSAYQVVLIDEPEAFLHPPQARLLGRRLAEESEGKQVFVATHDLHVLQGALEADQDVTVVRVQRSGTTNRPAVLNSAGIRELWKDPLLRYSNTLEGLFHRGVVVCEADTDARFYGAVLEHWAKANEEPSKDLLFTHTGGKDRLKLVVRALQALQVPVAVVADFDLFRDASVTRELLEALGGDWSQVETSWRVVNAAITKLGQEPPRLEVQRKINEILDGADAVVGRDEVREIREAIRLIDGWRSAKLGGLAAVPQGQPSEAALELVNQLKSHGLFVVPVGELERWAPQVAGHGTRWVIEALSRDVHRDTASQVASFVLEIAAWIDGLAGPAPTGLEGVGAS